MTRRNVFLSVDRTHRECSPPTGTASVSESFCAKRIISGENFQVNEEQSLVDRTEIESAFRDRLSEMENKMNDLHDIINALTARIYTEGDNRSLGDVLGYVFYTKIGINHVLVTSTC